MTLYFEMQMLNNSDHYKNRAHYLQKSSYGISPQFVLVAEEFFVLILKSNLKIGWYLHPWNRERFYLFFM